MGTFILDQRGRKKKSLFQGNVLSKMTTSLKKKKSQSLSNVGEECQSMKSTIYNEM